MGKVYKKLYAFVLLLKLFLDFLSYKLYFIMIFNRIQLNALKQSIQVSIGDLVYLTNVIKAHENVYMFKIIWNIM